MYIFAMNILKNKGFCQKLSRFVMDAAQWYNAHLKVVHLSNDYIPDQDRNLSPGFYFIIQIFNTDELIHPQLRVRIPLNAQEHTFHLKLHEIFFEDSDQDSFLEDLRANLLSTQGLGECAQELLMKTILDEAKAAAHATPYDPECSLVAVGVQLEVVRVIETWEIAILEEGSGLVLGQERCVICLEEFSEGDEVSSLQCSHVHHRHCILKWLVTGNNCPTCRFTLPCTTTGSD